MLIVPPVDTGAVTVRVVVPAALAVIPEPLMVSSPVPTGVITPVVKELEPETFTVTAPFAVVGVIPTPPVDCVVATTVEPVLIPSVSIPVAVIALEPSRFSLADPDLTIVTWSAVPAPVATSVNPALLRAAAVLPELKLSVVVPVLSVIVAAVDPVTPPAFVTVVMPVEIAGTLIAAVPADAPI